jgi:iron(III) transport system substrate-binding protein
MVRAGTWVVGLALVVGFAAGPAVAASVVDELGGEALIQAARKEGKVVVYTSNILSISRTLQLAFNKRFPDISVELVRLGGGALHSKIMTEHAAGKLVADVLEYSDRGLIQRAIERGIVGKHTAPTDGLYPAPTKISGMVYPGSVYLYLIAYNPVLVTDPPKNWMDLVDARFRGKIGLVPAELGGTPWMTALFQYQVLGKNSESYWQKLAAQKPRFFTSAAPLGKSVVSGETPVAVALDVVSLEDIKQGAPVKMVYPPEGVVVIVFNNAVTAAPKHPNAGRLWLNWTLSREGQEVWTKQIGGLSARTDIDPPAGAPRKVNTWQASEGDFVKLRDSYTRRWNEIFGYKP